MSSFLVSSDKGGHQEVSGNTMLRMLADPADLYDLLWNLRPGLTLPVKFKDGPGTVSRTPLLTDQSRPEQLPLDPDILPMQPMRAHGRLIFSLPADIVCNSRTTAETKEMIREYVKGRSGEPEGFDIQIDPSDLKSMIDRLNKSDVSVIDDVEFINVVPQLMLSGGQEI